MSDLQVIKVKEATITIAGLNFQVYQVPSGDYRVSFSQFAKALNANRKQVDRALKTEATELVILGEIIPAFSVSDSNPSTTSVPASPDADSKLRVVRSAVNKEVRLASPEQATIVAGYLAGLGNKDAVAFLIATATETFERRCDAAFNVSKTEAQYEEKTKSLREQWLESRDDARGNHMAFQNACLVNRIPAPLAHDRITKAITGKTAEEHRQLPIVAGTEDVGLNHVPEVSHEDLVKIAMVKDQFSRQKRGKTETWEAMVDRAIAKVI